jgi:OmpA-OmpF porin, OOP family
MKQLLLVIITTIGFFSGSSAQSAGQKKGPILAVNFVLNDFATAQRLQKGSLGGVLKDKQWATFSEMSYGLSVQYLEGLTDHVDFSGTLTGTFVKYPFPKKAMSTSDALLLELDAALNLKLLTDRYILVPYAVGGAGISMYQGRDFAAYVPLGMGFQLNLGKGDAFMFTQGLYKVGITNLAANHFSYSIGFAAPLK